jgi:hypothetical protein
MAVAMIPWLFAAVLLGAVLFGGGCLCGWLAGGRRRY